jgi:hypothetical protein
VSWGGGGSNSTKNDAHVASVPNGGRLNRVFELVGVAYGPRLEPGTEAHVEASKQRKVDAYSKVANKCMKVPVKKRTELLMIVVPRAKSSGKRPSDVEIASAKPVK